MSVQRTETREENDSCKKRHDQVQIHLVKTNVKNMLLLKRAGRRTSKIILKRESRAEKKTSILGPSSRDCYSLQRIVC